jgi:hypothetical protein
MALVTASVISSCTREVTIVAVGPDMITGFGFDQLPCDADAIAGLAETAFEHIPHPQFAPDLLYVNGPALVSKGRIARDDERARGSGREQ